MVAAFLLASGCGEKPQVVATLDEIAARALPYISSPAKETVVAGINEFCIDLYGKLATGNSDNLFFSPFSIESALAMTWAGAKGDTATEMAAALHFDLTQESFHPAFGQLLADINGAGSRSGYELSTANSLWVQKDYEILTPFSTTLGTSYGAALHATDFILGPETSRMDINGWVAGQTRDRILDLLPPGSIDETTRLVLANAIYFKGAWARTFLAKDTHSMSFRRSAGDSVTVQMMSQEAQFRYGRSGEAQILELPYTTGDLSMLFLLPADLDGLAALEAALPGGALDRLVDTLNPVDELSVTIPRFGFTSSFALKPRLEALGMLKAFGLADFTGITMAEQLAIGDVFHKSFVLVNEEGTEAAAATAVTMGATAMPEIFLADHPFIFLIRHNRSGAILFFGRVTDPSI